MKFSTFRAALTVLFIAAGFSFAETTAAHGQHRDVVEHAVQAEGVHSGSHAVGHDDAHAAEGGAHKLTPEANVIVGNRETGFAITNSMVMMWIATLIIVLFARTATKKMKMVPQGLQNFAEWLVESLYNFFGGVLGDHLVKRVFWFYGGTFLLILLTNWLGLIPGVGTIGWGHDGHMTAPFLRGGNADLNMTGAMSVVFAILWFYWAFTENGTKGFFAHIFAPKGDFKGAMQVGMVAIFFLVGLLEIVSIFIRPVALTFRLYGNIYGGEQTLESLMHLGGKYFAFMPALPFMFIEILVGLVQALVFTLLSAVFLKLICEHDDHGDEERAH